LESLFEFLIHAGIEFRHRFRLMSHPEVVDVLLATLPSKPCFSESTECVPAHTRLIEAHRFEALIEPAGLQVVVQVRCAVPGLKQQSVPAARECSQVLRDFGV